MFGWEGEGFFGGLEIRVDESYFIIIIVILYVL